MLRDGRQVRDVPSAGPNAARLADLIYGASRGRRGEVRVGGVRSNRDARCGVMAHSGRETVLLARLADLCELGVLIRVGSSLTYRLGFGSTK